MIVERRIDIGRPPEAVFDVLADPTTWATHDPALIDVQPRDRVVPGATGTMRRRAGLGMTVTTSWENTTYDPGACLEMLVRGSGYELRETVQFVATPTGTTVTVVDDLVPTSLVGRVMGALSGGIIERGLDARLARLKA
ncbi:MAG: SRPBCC family protein, partial [Chloroflexota bacterium]|nr:SRPBCC family protein [Chloroflexota bacterium]